MSDDSTSGGFKLQEDEDILKHCDQVVLKKLKGALILTTKRLVWTQTGAPKFLSLPFAIIKSTILKPLCVLHLLGN